MNALAHIKAWCDHQRHTLQQQSAWRTLGPLLPDGFIDFSSNDYLGFRAGTQWSPDALLRATRDGVGSGAARVVMQAHNALLQLEQKATEWLQWPHVLYCASGFQANMAIFETVASLEDVECFLDVRAHASLFIGGRASKASVTFFRHHDAAQLEKKLVASKAKIKVIFVESLHSMDGTFEDAAALARLCATTGAVLVVDEAHTAGICGDTGRGWVSQHPELSPHLLAVMFGVGKALGVSGGLIAGPQFFIDRLVNVAKSFIYTTAPSSLVAWATIRAIERIQTREADERRQALLQKVILAEKLKKQFDLARLYITPSSPILYLQLGSDAAAVQAAHLLWEKNLFVRAMRPPTVPRGTARLRLVLHAQHRDSEIEHLFAQLARLA